MKRLRVLIIMTYFFSQELSATRYTLDHSISLLGRYEDNISFSDVEKKNASAGIIDIYGSLSQSTPISEMNIFLNMNSTSYTDSVYNIDTQSFGFFYNRGFENGSWSLRGSEANRSDREINLALGGGDLASEDYQVDTQGLNFNFQNNLSERQNISIDIGFQGNDYEYPTRSDYDYWSSSTLWQFVINQRLRLQGRVSYSNYLQKEKSSEVFFDLSGFGQPYTEENHEQCRQGETLPNCGYVRKTSFEQKNKGLQLGVYYIFNELISFDSLIGLSKIDNIFYDLQEYYPKDNGIFVDNGSESNETSTTYQVNLYHKKETVDSTLSASSSNRIGGDGEVSPTVEYSLSNKWQLDDKQSLVSELGYLDRSLFNTTQGDKVKTKKIMISYSYDINPYWLVDISYTHMKRSKPTPNDFNASNNRIMFSIKWAPEKIQL
tara:strand:- start:1280 stop:2581 length:1302 start_codon:yes stop_codon:yes gene_type:complete